MALSSELLSQFAKAANNGSKAKSEKTVFGTIVEYDGSKYMKIDGSELLTPISSTTNVEADERVTGVIKDHRLLVTGNLSSPAARTKEVEKVGSKISEFEIVIADKISVGELEAERARIDELVADNATIHGTLTANSADISDIKADNVVIQDTLTANSADITDLKVENAVISGKLTAVDADIDTLQADNAVINETLVANEAAIGELEAKNVEINGTLTAMNADIENLQTDKLSAEDADIKYANIDFSNIGEAAIEYFYSTSGLIKNVVVGDQTITGQLVGVTISGDLIEGNTIVADKLVIKGEDGLYYKLNTNGITTEAEQTDHNSLNGSVIRAKTISATKIDVKDLVAFDATIGGFKITDDSIYSGAKKTISNTTRGIYMDNDGQMVFGDASNYVKFYKDTDGLYKLKISASDISIGGGKTFEESVNDEVRASLNSNNLVGRNLMIGTSDKWHYQTIDIGIVFHIPTADLVSRYGIDDGDQLIYSVYLKSTGSRKLVAGWLLTNGTYNLSNFNKSSAVAATSERRVVLSDIIFNSSYKYLALAIFNPDYETESTKLFLAKVLGSTGTVTEAYRCMQLEKGTNVSNWSHAPEDAYILIDDTNDDVDDLVDRVNTAEGGINSLDGRVDTAEKNVLDLKNIDEDLRKRLNSANVSIDNINATIETLVTGSNGETLMTQTDTGWTFNMANIQDTLASLTGYVNSLNLGSIDTQSKMDILKQAVADLGVYTEYIQFTIESGKPCIILGELDSDFKVKITNSDIRFMEGSVVPARISNQALNIGKAVVNDELQQGDFVWMSRSNGHYSLIKKG